MSLKPDLATLTTQQLREYVLAHRDDNDALQVYLQRRRSENQPSRVYTAQDDVGDAIASYLKNKTDQEAS